MQKGTNKIQPEILSFRL